MMEPINDRTMPYRRFETSDMEFNSVFNVKYDFYICIKFILSQI